MHGFHNTQTHRGRRLSRCLHAFREPGPNAMRAFYFHMTDGVLDHIQVERFLSRKAQYALQDESISVHDPRLTFGIATNNAVD